MSPGGDVIGIVVSYQLLTLGSPAGVLQLSVSHLRRIQVPRLPVEHRQRKQCHQTERCRHTCTRRSSASGAAAAAGGGGTSVAHHRTKL